jgi:probable selenium-dependent hydroxylase accessory protein YqeC
MLEQGGVISLVGSGGKTSLMFKLACELSMTGESVLTTTTTKIFEPEPDQTSCLIVSDTVTSLLNQAAELIDKHRHITMACDRLSAQGKLIGFAPEIIQALWNSHLFRWIIVEADGAAGRPLKAPATHEPVVPDCTSCLVGLVGLNGVGRPLIDQWVFRPERFAELAGISKGLDVTEASVVDVLTHKKGIFKNASAGVLRIVFLNQADTPKAFAAAQRTVRLLREKKKSGLDRVVIGQTRVDPPVLAVYELTSENGGR